MQSNPLAYFLTFHTYGSWLHGDSDGSVDRSHNKYGEPVLLPDKELEDSKEIMLKHKPLVLNTERRWVVDKTIREVCKHKGWNLLALNVRSNHVHVVLTAQERIERVLNNLKSWSTRRMIEQGVLESGRKGWSRHGSTRYLWTEEQVHSKCDYVLNCQGDNLKMTPPKSEQNNQSHDRQGVIGTKEKPCPPNAS